MVGRVAGGKTAVPSGPQVGNHVPELEFVRHGLAKRRSFHVCGKDQRMEVVLAAGMAAAAAADAAGRYPAVVVVVVDVVDKSLAVVGVVGKNLAVVGAVGNGPVVVVDVAGRGLPLPYTPAMVLRDSLEAVALSCSLSSSCRL